MQTRISILSRSFVALRAAVVLLLVIAGCGCAPLHLDYLVDSPFSNAGSITKWTLRQNDDDKIMDGIMALAWISRRTMRCDRDRAVEGMECIYEKMRIGWPGYTGISHYRKEDRQGPIPEARRKKNLEFCIWLLYDRLFNNVNPKAGDLFLRLKPDPRLNPRLAKIWNEVFTGKLEADPSLSSKGSSRSNDPPTISVYRDGSMRTSRTTPAGTVTSVFETFSCLLHFMS